jgi:ribonuclease-3 family protein
MPVAKISAHLIPALAVPLDKSRAAALSPLALAFIGDGVHSLFVRSQCTVGTDKKTGELHKEVTAQVCAKNQSAMSEKLLNSLTDEEKDIFRRARNSKILTSAKHAEIAEYRKASGFEAVLGFLYLTGQTQRIAELLEIGA